MQQQQHQRELVFSDQPATGYVYAGRHKLIDKRVAIKIMRAEFTRTCLQRPGSVNLAQLAEVFTALQDEARRRLQEAGKKGLGGLFR